MNNRSSSSPKLRDGSAGFRIMHVRSWGRRQRDRHFAAKRTIRMRNLRRNTVTTSSTEWWIFPPKLSKGLKLKRSNFNRQDARQSRSKDLKPLPMENGKHSFRTTTSSFAQKARPKGLR